MCEGFRERIIRVGGFRMQNGCDLTPSHGERTPKFYIAHSGKERPRLSWDP